MLYYAEDNATQHIEALLGGLYKGCRDEEIGVVKEVLYKHNKCDWLHLRHSKEWTGNALMLLTRHL